MRWSVVVGVVVWGLCGALTVGCKGDKKQSSEASEDVSQALADSGEIEKEEDDLLARRDALLKSRKRIREAREDLETKRAEVVAAGGDTSDLDKQATELDSEEAELGQTEDELNQKLDEIISQRRGMMAALAAAGGGEGVQVAGREASVASREKSLASRETRVAAREEAIASREKSFAQREQEMCSGVSAVPTIVSVDSKGSEYKKKDVDPLLRRARKSMSKKGILHSDLPAEAQGLEKTATKAMKKADYGKARFAAAQLVATVNAMQINKAFIAAKISRLSRRMKGKSLSSDKEAKVTKLFQEAQAAYGDGKFSSANRKLNKIYSLL
jgi:hypothetical protein